MSGYPKSSSIPIDKRLETAFARRGELLTITNAVRLVNGQGDGLPGLVIEKYHHHYVVHLLQAGWHGRLNDVVAYLTKKFNPHYLIEKDRAGAGETASENPRVHVVIDKEGPQTVVEENGLKFRVDLNDTVNTGLFLDMRANRKFLGEHCGAKAVLNCFSYTCSFGVYARQGKASRVVNVDMSGKILRRGEDNYRLSQFIPDKDEFTRADCMKYLEKAVKKNNFFDIVILDPPTFSRVDNKVFIVKKDMPKLVERAVKILKKGGGLFVSTNFSQLSHAMLEKMTRAAAQANQKKIKKIISLGQDTDFPGSGTMKESFLAALWVEFDSPLM